MNSQFSPPVQCSVVEFFKTNPRDISLKIAETVLALYNFNCTHARQPAEKNSSCIT